VPQEATEGQSFYATDALRMNLVDQIGTRQDALAELAALIRGGRK
jgi:ClpP class serine protease